MYFTAINKWVLNAAVNLHLCYCSCKMDSVCDARSTLSQRQENQQYTKLCAETCHPTLSLSHGYKCCKVFSAIQKASHTYSIEELIVSSCLRIIS